jgi:nitrite reductase/ring-hydroxylating ferredoxin subunit/uncharacterized membrane protein
MHHLVRQSLSRLFHLDPHHESRHGTHRAPDRGTDAGAGGAHEKTRPRRPGPAALAERVERAPALDDAVRVLSDAVVRALPPGSRADALHGVPFGQPAHPAVVRFPLGCWSSAVLLDFFPSTERASATLIALGLLGSAPSAATGLADWSALHRHQQRVGLIHGAFQAGATAMFGLSLAARATGRHREGKALSFCGLTVATAGTYLGGHLALRLGAGASHAESVSHLAALGWQDLCPASALPDGRPVRRQLGYLSLLVLRQGADVAVLSDHCAHLGGPLHQGRIVTVHGETCITCPWHSSVFRLRDGAVAHGPATARQPAFECQVTESGLVQVRPLLRAGFRCRGLASHALIRWRPAAG